MTKKNKNPIWVADEAATLPAHIANRLLDMLWAQPVKIKKQKRKDVVAFYMNAYTKEKAKADAKLAELFAYAPDPERPVQFAMPRALEKAVVGPREVVEALEKMEALVQPTNKYFCVQETAPWGNGDNVAEFEKMADGGFHVAATNRNGEEFADINMTAEQFAAFKQWVMEN